MTTETAPTNAPTITEQLVTALSAGWRAIQQRHPEVPDVVLTLGSGTLGQRGATVLGHFAAGRWQAAEQAGGGDRHELFVGGEGLRHGAAEVFGTLLHEAAHGLATSRTVADTSRRGYYHNKRFKQLAEELGLVVEDAGPRGWSTTRLAPSTAERYAGELAQLAAAITTFRRDEVPNGKTKSRNNVVATCACPRRIRVARAVLAAAPIICGACEAEFGAEDDDQADEGT